MWVVRLGGRPCLTLGFIGLFSLAFWIPSSPSAQEKPRASYVGVQVCKACHQKQFQTWSETRHARPGFLQVQLLWAGHQQVHLRQGPLRLLPRDGAGPTRRL